MSNLTSPLDIAYKPGDEIRIAMAAQKIYRGGAVGVILGTGYATPLVVATAGMTFIGVALETVDNSAGNAGDKYIRVARTGQAAFTQSGLTQSAVQKKVFFSDDNTVTLTPGAIEAGYVATVDQQNSKAWVDFGGSARVASTPLSLKVTAAGTALTNTTTETSLGSVSIPANTLKAGDRIRFIAQVIATATNSTDTLTVKAYLGGLSGTSIVTTGALDVANNDIAVVSGELVIRTSGASGTVVGAGFQTIGTPGTSTVKGWNLASSTVDTTAAQSIAISGTWSVANAGDSCRLDILSVDIVPA